MFLLILVSINYIIKEQYCKKIELKLVILAYQNNFYTINKYNSSLFTNFYSINMNIWSLIYLFRSVLKDFTN